MIPLPDGLLQSLEDVATRLRIESIRATTAAGSGHPTSAASAADLVAALFFATMRLDPDQPRSPLSDRFVLSKGHAAPLLYAVWAELGILKREELTTLRELSSDLEGHPTPRLPFVDVATGSLGQGLGVGAGLALGARMLGTDARVFVLLGDGETAEGSVWEAAQMAGHERLANLVAIVDVNGLGQSGPTMLGHDVKAYQRRFAAFGWRAVTLDGHDLRDVTQASLRAQIGVVTQENFLFSDTIRYNIAYGRPHAPFEEIVRAARQAHAHDFIVACPDGYDTLVGERGVRLSGGQRQRIAIARAFLKNPPILILDEATSDLDAESEFMIQQALAELMRGRTVLVIAHRLATVRNADRIVVVHDGRIAEIGRHDELIARDGIYRRLYALQMEGVAG